MSKTPRFLGFSIALAVLGLMQFPAATHAGADDPVPIVRLAQGFVLEPAIGIPWIGPPPEPQNFFMVGFISEFGPPLDFLHPWEDPAEYTFTWSGQHFGLGVWDDFENGRSGWFGSADTGVLRIYRDPSQNAFPGHPERFGDGELILEFEVPYLSLLQESCERVTVETFLMGVSGGSLESHLPPVPGGVEAHATGEFTSAQGCPGPGTCQSIWPTAVGCLVSDVFLDLPIPARPTSWGKLKATFR
ncbi:MAG: hypothetical protein ACREOU_05180 [Candidatus Eiseniibacteriota bacterium]